MDKHIRRLDTDLARFELEYKEKSSHQRTNLENKDNSYIEALVAHELTHCMLHQPHVDKPDHYMNAMEQRVYSKQWLEEHVKNFLNETCYE